MGTTAAAPPRRIDLITAWPEAKMGTGPALNKDESAARLGYGSKDSIETAIRRTRLGTAKVPFPAEDGYAMHPESKRRVLVPFWRERTIIAYGKATGRLDAQGVIIPAPTPAE